MRFIARYAKELKDAFEIVTVFDNDIQKEIIEKKEPKVKTIAHIYPSAIWFERKMSDEFGIKIENSFDNRYLIKHEKFPKNIYPLRKDFKEKELSFDTKESNYPYETILGDSVFQVSVGPIHAGIIEPGHFHFSQAGENMLHLEVRHFYKYKAIEKMLEGKTLFDAKKIIERISGNESIAYQIALRDIITQSSNITLDKTLQIEHAFLLELERVIHHLTDLGFIPNDAGFSSALSFTSKLAEDARRVMHTVTNHRFGFGAIEFKSLNFNKEYLLEFLNNLEKELSFFRDWIMDIPSLWDRFDTTGVLSNKNAQLYSSLGVVARASGVAIDRRDNSFYKEFGYEISLETKGDVASRFKVRLKELFNSITMMKNFLYANFNNTEIEQFDIKDGEYFSFCESSIGELFMSIVIKDGVIDRFFVRDASFINWQVLHLMMPNNIIADFPLINKSCDLSYAGNDL